MSDNLSEMRDEYVEALQEFLYEAGEAALQRAYELGRRALANDLGVLDLAAIHQEALITAILQTLSPDGGGLIARRAADFFMESLSPFEMSQRGIRETVTRVREANSTLELRVAERAEEARLAEQKYHDLFENAVEGIFQLTPDGRLITANPALARIFGSESPDALLASTPDLLDRTLSRADRTEVMSQVRQNGAVESFQVPARRLDGTPLWISINARAVRQHNGELRHFEGSIEDITDRKSAEILATAQRQVLEMIVAGASVSEVLVALEELLREQSDALDCAITLDPSLPGVRAPSPPPCDRREAHDHSDSMGFDRSQTGGLVGCRSTPVAVANGQTLATLTLRYPTHGGQAPEPGRRDESIVGAAVHLVRLVIDRERDAESLRRAEQQRLQTEKLRALGQLASGIAHDLNQSLALVAGYGELAREKLSGSAAGQDTQAMSRADVDALTDMLGIMRQAALDGGETVKQLLTFARGREEGQPVSVDLRQLLQDVARLTTPRWRDAAEAVGCHISLDVQAEDGLSIVGWPASLREALTNLVFNAVDALPNGGGIRLSARRQGGVCIVEIADTGIGMSPEVAARIFEPFFTTKGEGGTGLGLAHVFGVTERHQGQISVHSALGQGTTFRMELPAAASLTQTTPAATAPTEAVRGLRILSVDDEPALASMLALALRRDGHSTITARSGEEALVKLTAETVDLVITDIGMGAGMNGWELASQIRRHWPSIHVVLATGWGADIDLDEARERGISAVISKPYRLSVLRQTIRNLP